MQIFPSLFLKHLPLSPCTYSYLVDIGILYIGVNIEFYHFNYLRRYSLGILFLEIFLRNANNTKILRTMPAGAVLSHIIRDFSTQWIIILHKSIHNFLSTSHILTWHFKLSLGVGFHCILIYIINFITVNKYLFHLFQSAYWKN